jgi:hypothetical protein
MVILLPAIYDRSGGIARRLHVESPRRRAPSPHCVPQGTTRLKPLFGASTPVRGVNSNDFRD